MKAIEKTWHNDELLPTREDYLCALLDELLVEVSRNEDDKVAFFNPAPPTPEGGYISGKTFVPDHPIERALRALAWQFKNRPSETHRCTATVMAALRARKLVE